MSRWVIKRGVFWRDQNKKVCCSWGAGSGLVLVGEGREELGVNIGL